MEKREVGETVSTLLLRFLRGEISEEEMEKRANALLKQQQQERRPNRRSGIKGER